MSGVLELTPDMHVAYLAHDLDRRLAARKVLRPYRSRAANLGWKKRRAHG